MTGAPLETVALAMAAEFRHVEVGRAEARLDLIAAELGDLSSLPAPERARMMLTYLDERIGLTARADRDPEALMLDRVIDERSGHPYALAVVHAAIGRRCGLELFPVLAGKALLLADRGEDRTVIIDPLPGGRTLLSHPGWICPHVVGVMLLDAIGSRYLERGDISRAIRTAELRLNLPLDRDARERHEIELRGLRANLN